MDLRSACECPVCLEVPYPPIFQCSKGHHVCKSCYSKITECPLCKSKYTGGRNFALENILLSSPLSCKYKGDGCDFIGIGEVLMEKHIECCRFKPGICLLASGRTCPLTEEFKLEEIQDHLVSEHKALLCPARPFIKRRFSVRKTCPPGCHPDCPIILNYESNLFILSVLQKGFHFFWAVHIIGTQADADKYVAQVTLQPESAQRICWNFRVHPVGRWTLTNFVTKEKNIFKPFCTKADLTAISEKYGNEPSIEVEYKILQKNRLL